MAIKEDDLIVVRNRNRGETWIEIDGKWTTFSVDEVKKLPFKDLQTLTYKPGGQYTLDNYLVIENEEALDLLNMKVEPEYFYDNAKIKELLFNGSYDEFADFLDFAPNGALEIAKDMAVREEIPDMKKREMLGQKTGLNITSAIMVNHVMNEEDDNADNAPKQRRVPVDNAKSEVKERRAETPANKIVIKK